MTDEEPTSNAFDGPKPAARPETYPMRPAGGSSSGSRSFTTSEEVQIDPDAIWRWAGPVVVVTLGRDGTATLNGSTAAVWAALEHGSRAPHPQARIATAASVIDDAVNTIIDVGGLEADPARRSAEQALVQLMHRGLVRQTRGATPPGADPPLPTEGTGHRTTSDPKQTERAGLILNHTVEPSLSSTILTFGLPRIGQSAIPIRPDGPETEGFILHAQASRMGGLGLAAAFAGLWEPAGQGLGRLVDVMVGRYTLLNELETHIVGMYTELTDAGIDVRVVKGAASARLDYPAIEWRDFGDIDLLVSHSDFESAIELLIRSGLTFAVPPLRLRAAKFLGKGLTLKHPIGFEVDVHHSLAAASLGLVNPVDWMIEPVNFELGAKSLRGIPLHLRLVHAALHYAVGGRFVSEHTIREFLQLRLAVPEGSPAEHRAREVLAQFGLPMLDLHCCALAARDQGITVVDAAHPSQPIHRRPDAPDTFVTLGDSLRDVSEDFSSFELAARRALRGPLSRGQKLSVAAALAWPSSEHLRSRQIGRADWFVRMTRSLLGRGRST